MNLHFLSFLQLLVFFALLMVLGRAFFALTRLRMRGLALWLLSPAMGLVILGLLTGILNQAGTPVRSFGREMVFILGIAATGFLVWRRVLVPWRKLAIFAGVAVLWLAVGGWPLMRFGNDWVSFMNDDYANYCVGATRVLNYGFFDKPTVEQLAGKDLTAVYWFMHVKSGSRPVTDLVLAVYMDLYKTSAQAGFMPVMLVFGLVQAAALGGVLASAQRSRKASITATLVLLFAPMFVLGVYYHVFAQVGGLALVLLVLTILGRGGMIVHWRKEWVRAVPCAAACAGLIWFYPEAAPFALLPAGALQIMALVARPDSRRARLRWLTWSAGLAAVMLHINLLMVAGYFNKQVGHGGGAASNEIFPFFFGEEGWARFLGWSNLFGPASHWLSLAALIGTLFLAALLVWRFRFLPLLGSLVMVMLLTALWLRTGQNGFGLYKLAMFAQPLLAAGLAMVLHARIPLVVRGAIALAWFAATIPTFFQYREYALGMPGGPCEVIFASELGFPKASGAKGSCRIVNMKQSMEKLTVLTLGKKTLDPVPMGLAEANWNDEVLARLNFPDLSPESENGMKCRKHPSGLLYWDLQPGMPGSAARYIAEPHFLLAPLNRLYLSEKKKGWFALRKTDHLESRLVWTPSAMSSDPNAVSLIRRQTYVGFQMEPDFADPGRTLWAAGQYLLFELVSDETEVYLRIALSRSAAGKNKDNLSSRAAVNGRSAVPLGLVGSGSANVVVGPLEPLSLHGRRMLLLDLGQPAEKLFQNDVRKLSGWIRDVSALSVGARAQVKKLSIASLPGDLLQCPELEYSGFYENGDMGKEAWISLDIPDSPRKGLHLQGEVPRLEGAVSGNTLMVSLDGVPLRELELPSGKFDLVLELPPSGSQKVSVGLKWLHDRSTPSNYRSGTFANLAGIGIVPIQ